MQCFRLSEWTDESTRRKSDEVCVVCAPYAHIAYIPTHLVEGDLEHHECSKRNRITLYKPRAAGMTGLSKPTGIPGWVFIHSATEAAVTALLRGTGLRRLRLTITLFKVTRHESSGILDHAGNVQRELSPPCKIRENLGKW